MKALIQKIKSLHLIEDAWTHFHRSWAIRVSLVFGVLTGVLMGFPAFIDVLNPYLFMGLAVVFNILIIPVARLMKQAEMPPPAEKPAPAPQATP